MLEKIRTLLPVGSVVTLKEPEVRVIIYGYMQEAEDPETGKAVRCEYAGIPYPTGYMGEGSVIAFSRDSIDKVLFRGYDDNARLMFLQKLSDAEEEAADQELHLLEDM